MTIKFRSNSSAISFQILSRGIENIYNAAEVWVFEFFLSINCSKMIIDDLALPSVMEQKTRNPSLKLLYSLCIRGKEQELFLIVIII
jgi:hypothetical protein